MVRPCKVAKIGDGRFQKKLEQLPTFFYGHKTQLRQKAFQGRDKQKTVIQKDSSLTIKCCQSDAAA